MYATYYIVNHTPTNRNLPIMTGSSYWEPLTYPTNLPPRLFKTLRGAKSWIVAYCRGQAAPHYETHQEPFGDQYISGLDFIPVPGRQPNDFVVLEVGLSITDAFLVKGPSDA